MEGGSGNDQIVDYFVSPNDAVNLDLPPKIKGEAKVTSDGLGSDETEMAVGDSTEVDDGDDVVREISVFCASGNLGEDTQLYVMQHVLREAWRPYEFNKRCEEIRLKPKELKIEVDLKMEMGDINYDHEISKPLNLQKLTLSSTEVSLCSGIQYAVGFLEKNKFHLNPVHVILQLRPSSSSLHIDLPKIKFDSKSAKASTKATNVLLTNLQPWILLQYHPIDSFLSNKNKQKLAVEVARNVQFMMTPSDYLNFLPSEKLADETVSGAASTRDKDVIESLAVQSLSSETLKHLQRALLEIFNDKKVHSLLSIVNGLREISLDKSSLSKEDPKTRSLVNAAAKATSVPVKEFPSLIDQFLICIHGEYVLKSAGNPALDPLRNVVISLYQEKKRHAKLRKLEIKQAAKLSFSKKISDYEYYQVLHELCISKKNYWRLKSGE